MSRFVARYKEDWDELERLIARGRSWSARLTAVERDRLDVLYRRTTVHLARATTSGGDPQLVEYLNALTGAAHNVIYLAPSDSIAGRMTTYFVEGFGRAVARHWRAHLVSALLMIVGGLVGYVSAVADPITAHALWSAADERQPGSTPEQLLAHLRYGRDESGGEKFFFASFLFQHNLKVSLLAMATGVLAAAPTVLLMLLNGMMLGVFAAIHHQAGIRAELWAWLLPHGITELGAIALCGGVGLMLGHAVVCPGPIPRDQSLTIAGREAARTCVGCGAMLVVAAIIESYVRQSHWSTNARLGFAAITAVFWMLYFAFGFYREQRSRTLLRTTLDPVREDSAVESR